MTNTIYSEEERSWIAEANLMLSQSINNFFEIGKRLFFLKERGHSIKKVVREEMPLLDYFNALKMISGYEFVLEKKLDLSKVSFGKVKELMFLSKRDSNYLEIIRNYQSVRVEKEGETLREQDKVFVTGRDKNFGTSIEEKPFKVALAEREYLRMETYFFEIEDKLVEIRNDLAFHSQGFAKLNINRKYYERWGRHEVLKRELEKILGLLEFLNAKSSVQE